MEVSKFPTVTISAASKSFLKGSGRAAYVVAKITDGDQTKEVLYSVTFSNNFKNLIGKIGLQQSWKAVELGSGYLSIDRDKKTIILSNFTPLSTAGMAARLLGERDAGDWPNFSIVFR